jgi:uncharacterized membrane protein
MDGILEALTLATGVGCALAAGAFLAFSTFVMDGLGRAPEPAGMVAMQWINRRALTPPFMTALFAPALACAGLAVWALLSLGEDGAGFVLAGSLVYLAGAVGVTRAANVPLNDELEATDPAAGAAVWPRYLLRWTAWNHLRTLLCAVASVLLLLAVA